MFFLLFKYTKNIFPMTKYPFCNMSVFHRIKRFLFLLFIFASLICCFFLSLHVFYTMFSTLQFINFTVRSFSFFILVMNVLHLRKIFLNETVFYDNWSCDTSIVYILPYILNKKKKTLLRNRFSL